ncbi:hypothetical protein K3495_g17392, partial [Podosphaera aphanis]
MQLFTPITASLVNISTNEVSLNLTKVASNDKPDCINNVDQATIAGIFEDNELQNLWSKGVASDKDWRRARDSVKAGEGGFPPDLAAKMKVNFGDCTVTADGVLRGRENCIWIPDYEPLRTTIMQRTHDSHLAGHPGRDTM